MRIPVNGTNVVAWKPDGTSYRPLARDGRVELTLEGDKKMSPPILLVDQTADDEPVER